MTPPINCSPIIVVTGDKLSPVSLSPEINCSPVSTTPAIGRSLKIRDKDQYITTPAINLPVSMTPLNSFSPVSLFTGVVDTGDKHSFANISANIRQNSKRLQWNTGGLGDTDS